MMVVVSEEKPLNGLASFQIPKDVDVRLEAYCTRRSKVKRATVTRLIERFLASPDPVKSVLLGEEDEGLETAYAAWLEYMAKELREKGKSQKIIIDGQLGEFALPPHPDDRPPTKNPKRPKSPDGRR